MTLNDKEHGVLSYKLNDEDIGIAYDEINAEMQFCLALSLYWQGEGYELIG